MMRCSSSAGWRVAIANGEVWAGGEKRSASRRLFSASALAPASLITPPHPRPHLDSTPFPVLDRGMKRRLAAAALLLAVAAAALPGHGAREFIRLEDGTRLQVEEFRGASRLAALKHLWERAEVVVECSHGKVSGRAGEGGGRRVGAQLVRSWRVGHAAAGARGMHAAGGCEHLLAGHPHHARFPGKSLVPPARRTGLCCLHRRQHYGGAGGLCRQAHGLVRLGPPVGHQVIPAWGGRLEMRAVHVPLFVQPRNKRARPCRAGVAFERVGPLQG